MKRVLFLISSDPRASHRPAEAIRAAAGLGDGQNISITVYLREASVLVLFAPENLLDAETVERYLPLLCDRTNVLFAQANSTFLPAGCHWPASCTPLADEAVAELMRQHDYCACF